QPKVACRTHPEMLMAENAKCAVRGRGCCAEVRQMQSTVGVRFEEIFQSPHHSRVPPVRTANLDPLALAQALDHYPGQRLLSRSRYLCTRPHPGSPLPVVPTSLLHVP